MSLEGIQKMNQIHSLEGIQNQESLQQITSPNKVKISEEAQLLDKLSEMDGIRHDEVERIRSQILAGTYLDEAKLEEGMEKLWEDLL